MCRTVFPTVQKRPQTASPLQPGNRALEPNPSRKRRSNPRVGGSSPSSGIQKGPASARLVHEDPRSPPADFLTRFLRVSVPRSVDALATVRQWPLTRCSPPFAARPSMCPATFKTAQRMAIQHRLDPRQRRVRRIRLHENRRRAVRRPARGGSPRHRPRGTLQECRQAVSTVSTRSGPPKREREKRHSTRYPTRACIGSRSRPRTCPLRSGQSTPKPRS